MPGSAPVITTVIPSNCDGFSLLSLLLLPVISDFLRLLSSCTVRIFANSLAAFINTSSFENESSAVAVVPIPLTFSDPSSPARIAKGCAIISDASCSSAVLGSSSPQREERLPQVPPKRTQHYHMLMLPIAMPTFLLKVFRENVCIGKEEHPTGATKRTDSVRFWDDCAPQPGRSAILLSISNETTGENFEMRWHVILTR